MTTAARRPTKLLPGIGALLYREWLRFARQPARIIATTITPLLILVMLGSGFAQGMAPGLATTAEASGVSYAAYLVPGMAILVVVFASIFSAISLIEDRQHGFLQAVLTSPFSARLAILSKITACAIFGVTQAIVVMLALYVLGVSPSPLALALAVVPLLSAAITFSCLALLFAWRIDSSEGFHGVMNVVIMPAWLLSGAFFGDGSASSWLGAIMRLNPLYWATQSLRGTLIPSLGGATPMAWTITLALPLVMLGVTLLLTGSRPRA